MAGPVAVTGLAELTRAFDRANRELKKDLRAELAVAAEPVRHSAEQRAAAEITGIGNLRASSWGRMRTGVTARAVYVAPRQRTKAGHTGPRWKRPNLAALLMDRAMQPALDANITQVIRRLDFMLDVLVRQAAR